MFQVHTNHNGQVFGLKNTVWAYSMERATNFPTREAAMAALQKAKPFMKAAVYKAAFVVEVEA